MDTAWGRRRRFSEISVHKTSKRTFNLARLPAELAAGLTTAAVALPLCIGSGALAFSPLGAEHVAAGVMAGIVAAILGGSLAAVLRRPSFLAAIPTSSNGLIQASVLAALFTAFDRDAGPAFAALFACVALAGGVQIAIAATGLARIVKLAPYPVIAGFISGVGALIMAAQLPFLLAIPSLASIGALVLDAAAAARIAFAALLIAAMLGVGRWLRKVPPLLAGLIVGSLAYHAIRTVAPGLDLGPVVGAVDLLAWSPVSPLALATALHDGGYGTWRIVIGGAFTLAIVGTLDTVFALRAARNMADLVVDQDRDLAAQGCANVATALVGGIFVSTSVSLSSANFQAGGRSPVSVVAAGLILLAGLMLLPQLVGALPLIVLAAILLLVGYKIVDRWAVKQCARALVGASLERAQARRNIAVVLTVALATALGQPIVGAMVGVALACVVFMIEMNRPVVRRSETLERLRSRRLRSQAQYDFLTACGREVAVIELQGVLFFGNADDLTDTIERLPDVVRTVALDFSGVTDIDVSGALALQQTGTRLARHGRRLILCGIGHLQMTRAGALNASGVDVLPDLDAALEHVEEEIVARRTDAADRLEVALEATDFGMTLPPADLRIIADRMRQRTFPRGATLCKAGDAADRLWLLTRGSVSIWVVVAGRRRRVASIGPGCTVGEMGLLNGLPRSAEVCADEKVTAYELTASALDELLAVRPDVGHHVMTSIARQLAERLRRATEDMRA